MKNILLITDLTEQAQETTIQTATLAQQTNARLVVLYSLTNPNSAGSGDIEIETELAAQARLDALAQQLHQQFSISVTRLLKPNVQPHTILLIADQIKADKIINTTELHANSNLASHIETNPALLPL